MTPRPPESNRTTPLYPHTTLFRSAHRHPPRHPRPQQRQRRAPVRHAAAGGGEGGVAGVSENLVATDGSPSPAQRERSEEHTSELQSLMRISYAVFCLKKKKQTDTDIQMSTMNI